MPFFKEGISVRFINLQLYPLTRLVHVRIERNSSLFDDPASLPASESSQLP